MASPPTINYPHTNYGYQFLSTMPARVANSCTLAYLTPTTINPFAISLIATKVITDSIITYASTKLCNEEAINIKKTSHQRSANSDHSYVSLTAGKRNILNNYATFVAYSVIACAAFVFGTSNYSIFLATQFACDGLYSLIGNDLIKAKPSRFRCFITKSLTENIHNEFCKNILNDFFCWLSSEGLNVLKKYPEGTYFCKFTPPMAKSTFFELFLGGLLVNAFADKMVVTICGNPSNEVRLIISNVALAIFGYSYITCPTTSACYMALVLSALALTCVDSLSSYLLNAFEIHKIEQRRLPPHTV